MKKVFWSAVVRLCIAGIVGVAIVAAFVLTGHLLRACEDDESAIPGPFSVGCLPSDAPRP